VFLQAEAQRPKGSINGCYAVINASAFSAYRGQRRPFFGLTLTLSSHLQPCLSESSNSCVCNLWTNCMKYSSQETCISAAVWPVHALEKFCTGVLLNTDSTEMTAKLRLWVYTSNSSILHSTPLTPYSTPLPIPSIRHPSMLLKCPMSSSHNTGLYRSHSGSVISSCPVESCAVFCCRRERTPPR